MILLGARGRQGELGGRRWKGKSVYTRLLPAPTHYCHTPLYRTERSPRLLPLTLAAREE